MIEKKELHLSLIAILLKILQLDFYAFVCKETLKWKKYIKYSINEILE